MYVHLCLTHQGWAFVMYNYQDAVFSWVWIFFVPFITLTTFFLVSLILAIVIDSFLVEKNKVEAEVEEEENELEAEVQEYEWYWKWRKIFHIVPEEGGGPMR